MRSGQSPFKALLSLATHTACQADFQGLQIFNFGAPVWVVFCREASVGGPKTGLKCPASARAVWDRLLVRPLSLRPKPETPKSGSLPIWLAGCVSQVTFTTPVPQDFPRAVTRLVNLPTETSVTSVFRMQRKARGDGHTNWYLGIVSVESGVQEATN